MEVIKKDGTLEPFDKAKIVKAVSKSAARVMADLTEEQFGAIADAVEKKALERGLEKIPVSEMHCMVECALEEVDPRTAKSYREYRNYKKDFIHMMDEVYAKSQSIRYIGDKENANADSTLVTTKRCLIFNELNKRLYRKFFMTDEERQACKDGYIYIHDQSARLDTINCFSRDTRFITDRGVRSFRDFCDGDKVKVLSHKGIWRQATVHAYGWQKLQEVTFRRSTGKEKTVLVTPNHRWILKGGSETTDLKVGDRLIDTPKVANINLDDMTREDFKIWCLGFGLGDGSIILEYKTPTMKVRLCEEKVKYTNMFERAGYTITQPKCLNGDCFVVMSDIHSKDLPFWQLNKDNVKYFVHGLLCADGHRNLSYNSKSEFRGLQVTGDLNKYIYDLLNMAGYYVTSVRDISDQVTNYGPRTKETKFYQIYSDCGNFTWVVTKIKPMKLNPRAQVWCLDVEKDHSFLLEHGIPTGNCCLANVGEVMKGGFEMGNLWYNEPKTLDTAFDVMGDIILATASQQYGGFTVPEVDKILAPYAEKSYKKHLKEYMEVRSETEETDAAKNWAMKKTQREMEQGYQGIEYKLNTVASSRGDYPFVSMTFGLTTDVFGKMVSKTLLQVHREGHGKPGAKKPVLFPKLVFLYDKNLHGPGKVNEDVFEEGVLCSAKTMYPDWLSLTGEGYVPEMYKKYGAVVSNMGCRAFLSPWFERGGPEPADEEDKPVFVGRFNVGAVSLHLPMILAKAREENRDFYEVLDYYLEMIRGVHKRTYDYLGELHASVNPIMFCEGGAYGGYLDPHDKIKPLLKPMTASFGITALNELQELHNGKSITEDGAFALVVLKYINNKVAEFKKEDGWLYAIYGTPAENLCGLQIEQFRKKYGVIKGVSDRPYVSNSFHCHVTEDISPIQKQDLEGRFWNYCNGGKIQYVRYPVDYNLEAVRTLIRRAMDLGFYEGVNLSLAYCDDCGHQELEMDVCPVCGSSNLTKIDRMNGYLAYSRVHGDTRLNKAKMAEIAERKSM